MKGSEGGDSWDTAYWVVYLSEELAQLNEKSTINFYKSPEPNKQRDFSSNSYVASIPQDVLT